MTTRVTRSSRRRTVVAFMVVLAMTGVFVVRLIDIQVVSASAHLAEAHANDRLGVERTVPGVRGPILDASGTVLAASVIVYDAQLDPSLIVELENDSVRPPAVRWEEASEQIAAITGQAAEDIRASVIERLAQEPGSQYLPLIRSLDTEQYLRLRELGLPYLAMIPRGTRIYPNGAVAGNIIGFIGSDGQALEGYEMLANECLSATDGEETYLRGKNGVRIPGTEQSTEAIDGGTLQLTLDSDLNWYLQQVLAEEVQAQGAVAGTIVVVEVATGKIRAAAEYPMLDPNDIDATTAEDRGSRIFRTSFEPGSTFKAMTMATVLEETQLTPLSTVVAADYHRFPNGAAIGDFSGHPTYRYTLAGAIIDSSNVAFAKLAENVPATTRHDYLAAFGVGAGTEVGFPGEAQGVLHPASEWDNQSYYTTSFGQHFTVTVPQVASAYQTIANGGVRLPLQLVESCTLSDGTVIEPDRGEERRVVSEQTAAEVRLMLENALSQNWNVRELQVPGYRVAVKSGTAQKPDADGSYKDGVYYVSLAGFAPADDPEYVVVVTMDEPRHRISSSAVAPAFQKAVAQVMKTFRVLPSDQPQDTSLPRTL